MLMCVSQLSNMRFFVPAPPVYFFTPPVNLFVPPVHRPANNSKPIDNCG